MPTAFEFEYRYEDFVDKLLKDHPELEPYRSVLGDYASTHSARDDDLEAFLDSDSFAPGIGVDLNVAQNVNSATLTALAFDTLSFQSTDLFTWDPGQPSKLTLNTSGVVSVTATSYFNGSVGGSIRACQIFVNGITEIGANTGANPSGNPARTPAVGIEPLVAGDYIELKVNQDSGGVLGVKGKLRASYSGKVG
jgi:hypothetical protein